MNKSVYAVATMDTKGEELAYVARCLQAVGVAVKTVDDNNFIPVAFFLIHPCTGELVFFEGTDHVIIKIWDNGHYKVHVQYNLNGVDGNGLKYRYTDAANDQGTGGFPIVSTSTGKVVSATGEDNIIWTYHTTINANGDVTSDIANAKCVG